MASEGAQVQMRRRRVADFMILVCNLFVGNDCISRGRHAKHKAIG